MSRLRHDARIAIAGAGSVGCYVGASLQCAGRTVTLLTRDRLAGPIRERGLEISDLTGLKQRIAPGALPATADTRQAFAGADVILVTVKGFDTEAMADLVARHGEPRALVVSLQNGAGNAGRIAARLAEGQRAVAGMVPFNILQVLGEGVPPRFHRGVSGTALVAAGHPGLQALLDVPGFPVGEHDRLADVLWSKLLINLNNALNALSGVPLKQEFSQRGWRRLLAGQIREAMAVFAAEGIGLAPIEGVHPRYLPFLLNLPDVVFARVARAMLQIDPEARSSMWEDLERRRKTEIDRLQGAVLALAGRHAIATPLIGRVHGLVKAAERAGNGSPALRPEAIA